MGAWSPTGETFSVRTIWESHLDLRKTGMDDRKEYGGVVMRCHPERRGNIKVFQDYDA